MKWLFFLPLIALLDPLILIWIWPRLSPAMLIGGLLVFPLIVTFVARRKISDADRMFMWVRNAARIAAWYPGPISKIVSIVLLLPPVERAILNRAVSMMLPPQHRDLFNAAMKQNSGKPPPPAERDEHGMKRAKGRVIE